MKRFFETPEDVRDHVARMIADHSFEHPADTLLGKLERKVFENEMDSFERAETRKIKERREEEKRQTAALERARKEAALKRAQDEKVALIDRVTTQGTKISSEIYVLEGQVYLYKEAWETWQEIARTPSGREEKGVYVPRKKRRPRHWDRLEILSEAEILALPERVLRGVFSAISRQ